LGPLHCQRNCLCNLRNATCNSGCTAKCSSDVQQCCVICDRRRFCIYLQSNYISFRCSVPCFLPSKQKTRRRTGLELRSGLGLATGFDLSLWYKYAGIGRLILRNPVSATVDVTIIIGRTHNGTIIICSNACNLK